MTVIPLGKVYFSYLTSWASAQLAAPARRTTITRMRNVMPYSGRVSSSGWRAGRPRYYRVHTCRRAGLAAIMLIDTHCHLNDAKAFPDPAAVLEEAKAAGVDRVFVVGVDAEDSRRAL